MQSYPIANANSPLDIRQAYDQTNDTEVQDFIQNLALFFSTFLGKHVRVIDRDHAMSDLRCSNKEGIERMFSTRTDTF